MCARVCGSNQGPVLLLKSRKGMRVSNQEAAPVTSGGIYGADDRSESETALIRSGSVGSSAP